MPSLDFSNQSSDNNSVMLVPSDRHSSSHRFDAWVFSREAPTTPAPGFLRIRRVPQDSQEASQAISRNGPAMNIDPVDDRTYDRPFSSDPSDHYHHVPRLRSPQTVVHRDAEGNVSDHFNSISSSIYMLRTHEIYGDIVGDEHDINPSLARLPAVDLDKLLNVRAEEGHSSTGYSQLPFEVYNHDGGLLSYHFDVNNVLHNDMRVYCSNRRSVVNLLLKYKGFVIPRWEESCTLTHIVLKSPSQGYRSPYKTGMIFTSNEMMSFDESNLFNTFTKPDFERYKKRSRGKLIDGDPITWFELNPTGTTVIHLREKMCKYVLIKFFVNTPEAEHVDLQYIGLVGYAGSRGFGSGRLC